MDGLAEGRTGVVMKIHHAVTDGMGMVQMTESLVERGREPDPEWEAKRDAKLRARSAASDPEPLSELDHLRGAAAQRVSAFADRATRFGRALGRGVGHVAEDPAAAATRLRDKLGSLGRLLRPVTEPLSPIMTGRSLTCRFDVLTIPLDDLKRAGRVNEGRHPERRLRGRGGRRAASLPRAPRSRRRRAAHEHADQRA